MKTLGSLIKGKNIFYVDGNDTISSVINYMAENNIGAVPVICSGKLEGIFSERDVIKRVISKKVDLDKTKVEDVMTRDLIVMETTDTYEDCLSVMKRKSIRHIPVRDGDRLVGVVSLRDLLNTSVNDKTEEIDLLREYIYFQP